jgi:hypothetical protein
MSGGRGDLQPLINGHASFRRSQGFCAWDAFLRLHFAFGGPFATGEAAWLSVS